MINAAGRELCREVTKSCDCCDIAPASDREGTAVDVHGFAHRRLSLEEAAELIALATFSVFMMTLGLMVRARRWQLARASER